VTSARNEIAALSDAAAEEALLAELGEDRSTRPLIAGQGPN
jgi:hypothetical protein